MSAWRRLLGLPLRAIPFTADTPDGAYVELTGITRALPDEDTLVPPLCGELCVVARIKFNLTRSPDGRRTLATNFERFHNRPFVVENGALRLIVDSAHLRLDVVTHSEGQTTEYCVPEGASVNVRGTVMRDGVTWPSQASGFRDAPAVHKLVGSKRRPVIITRTR